MIIMTKKSFLIQFPQVIYGKNGSGPQIKRNIRKFAGFEDDERQTKLDMLLTYELPQLQQTATILDLKDIKSDDTKENFAKAIVDFLILPTGKTIAETEPAEPEEDGEEVDEKDAEGGEEEEEEEPEDEEEEEVKPKGSPRKRGGQQSSAGRPKRATATRVWTKGEFFWLTQGFSLILSRFGA